jgi:predicted membrane channel-forming protein YqfA (hemolysin III family)
MTRREQHEDRVERMKLLYDLNKHMTTLSTGTLLLMAGLFGQVFKAPLWKPLAAGAFVLFACCVVTCVFAMFGFAMYSRATFATANDPVEFGVKAFAVALMLFVLGVVFFAVFSLKNL